MCEEQHLYVTEKLSAPCLPFVLNFDQIGSSQKNVLWVRCASERIPNCTNSVPSPIHHRYCECTAFTDHQARALFHWVHHLNGEATADAMAVAFWKVRTFYVSPDISTRTTRYSSNPRALVARLDCASANYTDKSSFIMRQKCSRGFSWRR